MNKSEYFILSIICFLSIGICQAYVKGGTAKAVPPAPRHIIIMDEIWCSNFAHKTTLSRKKFIEDNLGKDIDFINTHGYSFVEDIVELEEYYLIIISNSLVRKKFTSKSFPFKVHVLVNKKEGKNLLNISRGDDVIFIGQIMGYEDNALNVIMKQFVTHSGNRR
jgi:hypothetical protein